MSIENSSWFYLAIAIVCFNTGLSKGGFGGVVGALSTPFLSLFIPANIAAGIMLPILMLGDVFSVSTYWRRWDYDVLIRTLPLAIFTTALGSVFVSVAPALLLKRAVGVIALVFAVWQLLQSYVLKPSAVALPGWAGPLAGGVAGTTSALANAGGPPMVIYMLMRRMEPKLLVATSALFFALLNLTKVPFWLYSGVLQIDRLFTYWWLMPLVPLGIWVGRKIVNRINRKLFEHLILIFLAITGVLLLMG